MSQCEICESTPSQKLLHFCAHWQSHVKRKESFEHTVFIKDLVLMLFTDKAASEAQVL